jgi:hypothetical protein
MDLLAFFEWCEATAIGETIRNSTWMFPVIEAFHLLGLGVIGGAILLVNLRLLGVGLSRQPAGELSASVEPFLIGAVTLMIASGVPLFLSEAIKCFYSTPFWVKMTCLLLALIFTFTFQRHVTRKGLTTNNPLLSRFTGATSLALWGGVAWGGRWIAFSG